MRWALKQYLVSHAREVERSIREPRQAQERAFARIQRELRQSELARASGLTSFRTLEECRRLPRHDCDNLRPWLDRAFERGSARAFGGSKLHAFARTSGTSGHHKHIPLNSAYLRSLDRTLVRMVASYHYTTGRWDRFLNGKQIMLGSRPELGDSPTGLPVCDISGFIPTRTWRLFRSFYIPRHEDLWIEDWEEKATRILEQAKDQDVIAIAGIPALARDFARRARERYGVSRLCELWPNLSFYIFGSMGLAENQRKELSDAWVGPSGKLSFVESYFSTEAQLAFSFDTTVPGLALNTLENLFLFVPEGGGDARFVDELEAGKRYEVLVTTPGGLVNYAMGDLIEVVSAQPLLVRVAGRLQDEISMTGEKISLQQLDLALTDAGLPAAGAALAWAEEFDERPYLVWGIPSRALPSNLESACAALDDSLCARNSLYLEALRHERVIGPSKIVGVPESLLELHNRARLGKGQHKPKRIFGSREELTEALGARF